jgi:ABC-type antimicrobial peptide transport system permease subunit
VARMYVKYAAWRGTSKWMILRNWL